MTGRLVLLLAVVAPLAWVGWMVQQATDPPRQQPAYAVAPAPQPAPPPAAPADATATGPQVDQSWVTRTAAAAGLSEVAVAAYGRAVLDAPDSCRLGWTTLAGIGWVESENGTLGGRYLQPDGLPSTPILGPALDGSAYAAVPATRAGADYHGDSRWEHAVGPLQFLPSTWATYGQGGDITDPEDAIPAAARFLVAHGAHGPDGMSGALYAYNNSTAYVQGVSLIAQIMDRRPRSYLGYYNWEVYYRTTAGDVHLPVGYDEPHTVPVDRYLRDHSGALLTS